MRKSNLLKISYAPMDQEEREKLEKSFKLLVPLGIFIFVILAVISYAMDFSFFGILIDVLFMVGFVMIYRAFKLDLKEGEKKIWQGLVTNKDYTVKSNKDSKSSYTYYFYFGDQKKSVRKDVYNEFNVGDFIEIHQAKRVWGIYFDTKLLKENAMPEAVAEYQDQSTVSTSKSLNKIGCFLFLLIGALMGLWFLVMAGIIDLPLIKGYFIEFMNNLE